MKNYIIPIILGLSLGIAKLCISFKASQKEAYRKTFACPNCGALFNARWYQMIFKTGSVYTCGAAHLKCPACHQRDMCSISHDDR